MSPIRPLALLLLLSACKAPPAPEPIANPAVSAGASTPPVPVPAPAPAPTAAAPAKPHPFWLVLAEAGALYLEVGAGLDAWGRGAPSLVGDAAWISAVRREVDPAKVPPEHRALIGQRVTLFDVAGKPCAPEVEVGGLELIERLYFQDALTDATNVRWGAVAEASRATDSPLVAAAKTAWIRERSDRTLVARLTGGVACSGVLGALWAQPAGLPAPQVAPFEDEKGPLARAALDALHALPVYARIQTVYAKKRKKADAARWTDLSDSSESVSVATLPGREKIVHVMAGVCLGYNAFNINLEVFWSLSGTASAPQLTLLGDAAPSEQRWVETAADIDGDGKIDLIALDGILMARGSAFALHQQRFRLAFTCPGDFMGAAEFDRIK